MEQWQVPLWDAINRVVVASRGDPGHISEARMNAVVEVNDVVREAEKAAVARAHDNVRYNRRGRRRHGPL